MTREKWWHRSIAKNVDDYEWLTENKLTIRRTEFDDLYAIVLEAQRIDVAEVAAVLVANPEVRCLVHTNNNTIWEGAAVIAAERHPVSWGRLGVLYQAAKMESPETAVDLNIKFARRMLTQHQRMISVQPIFGRVYRARLSGGQELTVAFAHEYSVTASFVQEMIETYGSFDVLLITNPYGNYTSDANESAASAGMSIETLKSCIHLLYKTQ